MQLRSDGRALVAWHPVPSSDGNPRLAPIELWDFDSGPRVRLLPPPKADSPVASITSFFWPKNRNVVVATAGHQLVAWNLSALEIVIDEIWIEAIAALSPTGDFLLVANQVGSAGLVDLAHPKAVQRQTIYGDGVTGATQDLLWASGTVAAITLPNDAIFFDGKSGAVRRRFRSNMAEQGGALAATLRGHLVALALSDGRLELLDPTTLSTRKTLTRAQPTPKSSPSSTSLAIVALAFSPDGKSLAAIRADGLLSVWDVAAGSQRTVAAESGCDVATRGTVRYSPDGAHLLCSSQDALLLWDAAAPLPPRKLPLGNPVWLDRGAQLSLLTSGEAGQAMTYWDPKTGEKRDVRRLADKDQPLSLSGDVRYSATVPSDTRLERLSDRKTIFLRAVRVKDRTIPAVYTEDGLFTGDDDVCRALLARTGPTGALEDPTPEDCTERRRPDIAADFFANRPLGSSK